MSKNKMKDPEKTQKQEGSGRLTKTLQNLLDGSFLAKGQATAMLPFLLFLTLVAALLIANTYYAEKKVRRIEQLRAEVTELHVRYITNKSELMFLSNQSEISRRLHAQGFIESRVPPRKVAERYQNKHFFLRILGR